MGISVASSASTLSFVLNSRLQRLCAALGLDAEPIVAQVRDVVAPWIDAAPAGWRSEISDDNSPVEMSVTFDRTGASLRLLFEPQARSASLAAMREASLAFHAELEANHDVDLQRFRAVEDLFLPPELHGGAFAAWSSLVFERDKRPSFKVYLNPNARGRSAARPLVEEALRRLGLARAWADVAAVTPRGPLLDELKYFALDLSRDASARVKVYVHRHRASATALELACAGAVNHVPGEVQAFARTLAGDAPMRVRAPFTCHAYTSTRPQATVTAYVPACAYARDDAEVLARTSQYLVTRGLDPSIYRRVVESATSRSLDAGVGLQSWCALRCNGDDPRLTVYLATEARRKFAPGEVPAPSPDPEHPSHVLTSNQNIGSSQ